MEPTEPLEQSLPRSRTSSIIEMVQTLNDLSGPLHHAYHILLCLAVLAMSILQGYLTYKNESDLIDLQIDETCNAVFDATERGWAEIKLFTETVAAGFYADSLDISQEKFTKLGQSSILQGLSAMENLEFVHHLKDNQARDEWIEQIINEFSSNPESRKLVQEFVFDADWGPHKTSGGSLYPNRNISDFYMFTFDPEDPFGRISMKNNTVNMLGQEWYDPIVYMATFDPYLWGFYPDPEVPRISALDLAMETDATSCTNRINLFGPKLADNPSGIICAMPVWKTDDGKVHPSKPEDASHDDCYGFVVPVIVGRLLLNNIFEADAFGTDIEDIVVYAYDVGDDAADNFITTIEGEVIDSTGSWFIGRYPQPSHVEEVDGTVISREVDAITQRVEADEISRNGFAEIPSKTMKIGERDWKIYCGVQDGYISKKRSNLPYIIAAISIGASVMWNLFRILLRKCMVLTQDTMTRQSSKAPYTLDSV